MNRPHFSRKDRDRLFELRGGTCYLCSGAIQRETQAWDIEHEIPWEISRDNSDDNLQLAHRKCHAVKTAKDAGDIAKVKRIEAKHKGTWPKTRAPIRSRGFASTRPSCLWPASSTEHDGSD